MIHSDLDNGPHIRPQRFPADWTRTFRAGNAGRCRRILIPFGEEALREGVLTSAIEAARLSPAEFIFLTVHPPASAPKPVPDQESLFTALKAFQAQLQSYRLRVQFDSVAGPAAASIAAYARDHRVDLIVMAGAQAEAETGDNVAEAVLDEAPCPTFIVQEN